MREFRITEAQLDELASLNNETAEEARRSDEIVEEVKAQPVPDQAPQPPAAE